MAGEGQERALARQSRPEQQEQADSQSRPASNWSARCDRCMQWFEVELEQLPARSTVLLGQVLPIWLHFHTSEFTPKR